MHANTQRQMNKTEKMWQGIELGHLPKSPNVMKCCSAVQTGRSTTLAVEKFCTLMKRFA